MCIRSNFKFRVRIYHTIFIYQYAVWRHIEIATAAAFFNNLADIILYIPTFYVFARVIKDDKILKRYIRI